LVTTPTPNISVEESCWSLDERNNWALYYKEKAEAKAASLAMRNPEAKDILVRYSLRRHSTQC
jgi:hypothetical protein